MGTNHFTIGQPGPPTPWPYQEIESWLAVNAWTWVSAQNVRPSGLSGSKVATWHDLSDNNHNWSQGTDLNRPTLQFGVLNGLPGVQFDPANSQVLGCPNGIDEMEAESPDGDASRELWLLARADSIDPAGNGFMGSGSGGDMFLRRDVFNQAGSYAYRTAQTSASPTWPEVRSFPGAGDVFLWRQQADDPSGVGPRIRSWWNKDGQVFTSNGKPVSWNAVDALNLGRAANSSNEWFMDGYIFEAIVFNWHIENEARRTEIVNYLYAKWNL